MVKNAMRDLHYAVKLENKYLLNNLLHQGANVETRDIFGMTPLHEAVKWGNLYFVNALIRAGANVNARIGGIGLTPSNWRPTEDIFKWSRH